MKPRYNIGDLIDTDQFGPAKVIDIFESIVDKEVAYELQTESGETWLIKETDL